MANVSHGEAAQKDDDAEKFDATKFDNKDIYKKPLFGCMYIDLLIIWKTGLFVNAYRVLP